MHQACAKLNLYLHIVTARADGYHDLESLVVFTDLADTLSVEPANTLSLAVTGEFAATSGAADKNLVLKAAQALREATGTKQTARLTLSKQIPAGAGLGGGSADAAAALQLLNTYWQLGLPDASLRKLASKLGADVAMCLVSKPAIANGIGDKLVPFAELPEMHAVIAYPNTPLSTAQVYAALTEERRFIKDSERRRKKVKVEAGDGGLFPSRPEKSFAAFVAQLGKTRNDLQRAAITLMPNVAEVLLALETAPGPTRFVRMSGSGSGCFALVEKPEDARTLAAHVAADYPEWWVRAVAVKR